MEHSIDTSFAGAVAVYVADVDGDGDSDVLAAAEDAGEVAWWENLNGSGLSWGQRNIDTSFSGARSVGAADVDGDGDVDALGAAFDDADVQWWSNVNGDGLSWSARAVDTSFLGASSVDAADVDGDGDVDLIGSAELADDIVWWENGNGLGTSWTEWSIDGSFDGSAAVAVADLDGDTDRDVVAVAENADDVVRWLNRNPICGDVEADEDLDTADVAAYRGSLADPLGAALSTAGQARCDVVAPANGCDLLDLVLLRRQIEGPALPPGLTQVCPAAP